MTIHELIAGVEPEQVKCDDAYRAARALSLCDCTLDQWRAEWRAQHVKPAEPAKKGGRKRTPNGGKADASE